MSTSTSQEIWVTKHTDNQKQKQMRPKQIVRGTFWRVHNMGRVREPPRRRNDYQETGNIAHELCVTRCPVACLVRWGCPDESDYQDPG